MTDRRFTVLTFAALMLGSLLVPAAANAQGTIWDRVRERARERREEEIRRGRRDDDYYRRGRGGRMSDYERRALRDVARRLESRSRDLERDVDYLLDHSRYDGSRREDRINSEVQGFRRAADRFQNVAGDSQDLYRSRDDAQRLFTEAAQVDRLLSRIRLDSRTFNDWAQIRADLRTVADIYGIRFRDFDDRNYRRDDDFYRRRDRDRHRRRGNNDWRWE